MTKVLAEHVIACKGKSCWECSFCINGLDIKTGERPKQCVLFNKYLTLMENSSYCYRLPECISAEVK
jgi:hypothetical protein